MKVAVAGHPESTPIPHFGHAELFTIFDLSEDPPRLLEVRSNRPHCGDAGGDRPQLDQTVTLLADCVAVLAAKAEVQRDGVLRRRLERSWKGKPNDHPHEPPQDLPAENQRGGRP